MYKKFGKRLIDILIGGCSLPFVGMAIMICGPIIYCTDRGPIFYNSIRLGKDGRPYQMYKLRSMKVNAPDIRNTDGSTYNGDNDPRVTKIGHFMRKTSIDELPQFLNVLKGDMSIIGPRPTVPIEGFNIDALSGNERAHYKVKPGITGYSQAYYRNSINQDEKFQYDTYYAENVSFALDIKVFFKTIQSVIGQKNIYNK